MHSERASSAKYALHKRIDYSSSRWPDSGFWDFAFVLLFLKLTGTFAVLGLLPASFLTLGRVGDVLGKLGT